MDLFPPEKPAAYDALAPLADRMRPVRTLWKYRASAHAAPGAFEYQSPVGCRVVLEDVIIDIK